MVDADDRRALQIWLLWLTLVAVTAIVLATAFLYSHFHGTGRAALSTHHAARSTKPAHH